MEQVKEDVYVWEDSELPLGRMPVVVREFKVTDFNESSTGLAAEAKGTITCVDYVEHGFEFTDDWYALCQSLRSGEAGWTIVPVRHGKRDVPRQNTPPSFTMNNAINRSMEAFMRKQLASLVEFRKNGLTKKIVVGKPRPYQGPRDTYQGACLCREVGISSIQKPFDWERATGKHFPEHCFKCSCGAMWWEADAGRHLWVRVNNQETFSHLMAYGGVPRKLITAFDRGCELMETIVKRGFIPL